MKRGGGREGGREREREREREMHKNKKKGGKVYDQLTHVRVQNTISIRVIQQEHN